MWNQFRSRARFRILFGLANDMRGILFLQIFHSGSLCELPFKSFVECTKTGKNELKSERVRGCGVEARAWRHELGALGALDYGGNGNGFFRFRSTHPLPPLAHSASTLPAPLHAICMS